MEPRQNKYISSFKIDNVPILPPLMTDEKRQEMRRYKDLASMLEIKLKLKAETKINAPPINQPRNELNELREQTPCGDEYLKFQRLLQGTSEESMQVLFKKENRNRLTKSDTFIFDIITNTVIMPYDSRYNYDHCRNAYDNYSSDRKKMEMQKPQTEIYDSIKPSQTKPKVTENKMSSPTNSKLEWCANRSPRKESTPLKQFINSQVPQISVEPPTPEYMTPSRESFNKTAENDVTPSSRESAPSSRESDDRRSEAKSTSSRESRPKTPKRSTTSPSITSEFAPRLIRSNSFTLDSPSNALLRHLATQGSNSFDFETNSNPPELDSPSNALLRHLATQRSNSFNFETKTNPPDNVSKEFTPSDDSERSKTKIEIKTASAKLKDEVSPPKQNRKVNTLLITNSTMYKNKRSPYDVKLCVRPKILKKHKSPVVRTISAIGIKHRNRHSSRKSEEAKLDQIKTSDTMNVNDMFKGMDEAQKQRLLDLIRIQEEEQKRMKEKFEMEQKLLLQELSNCTNSATTDFDCSEDAYLKPSEGSFKTSLEQKQENVLSVKNSKNVPCNKILTITVQNSKDLLKPSPRKKLFSDEQGSKSKERPPTPARRREKAATTLQAYVRGFLVRRLLRTKHVQKIVQIIQDTLLFVLKLHMETRYDNSENNIRLKARLLQQLSSSSLALHKIFIEIPTKERMQIIRKDRLFIANDSTRSPRK